MLYQERNIVMISMSLKVISKLPTNVRHTKGFSEFIMVINWSSLISLFFPNIETKKKRSAENKPEGDEKTFEKSKTFISTFAHQHPNGKTIGNEMTCTVDSKASANSYILGSPLTYQTKHPFRSIYGHTTLAGVFTKPFVDAEWEYLIKNNETVTKLLSSNFNKGSAM